MPALQLQPEVASLNMGSMNFGLFPMLGRYKDLRHDWEKPFLESTRDTVFKNTFADIEFVLTRGTANGTRFEFECYDTAHLYNLAHFLDRKLATPPLFVPTVFGGFAVGRAGATGHEQRRPGAPRAADPAGPGAGRGHAGRGAGDAETQGA